MSRTLLLLLITFVRSEYIPPGPRYPCPRETDIIHPCVCESGTDDGLFVRCENAGLATLGVGLGNLASLDVPVERLLLRECHFSRLFGPIFRRIKARILRIEDTPLVKIEPDTFLGINRTLQELYIVRTQLETFPKEAFKVLGNTSILYIDSHDISSLDKDSFSDSLLAGKLEKLHLINGNIEDIPTEPFQHLKKLKTLDFHGNRISTLKRNQFKGLRDTELLDLSHNNISKLEGSHIGDLTKLGWCNVSHNNIAEITRGVFARNALLKVLHMDNNLLKKLDTNSFRGLRFLRRLYLQDNQISDVGRGTFSSILRIGTIDLARNLIAKVDYQMFYELKYVETINLSQNNITLIESQSFKDLYQTVLNISHNQLETIEPNSFINCGNLTLDLSHNNLSNINKLAFDVNTYALDFLLSYNQFTELNQVPISNMTGLKVLNVSHNQIHTIPRNTFPKLYELHTVDLSHNRLKDIFGSVFQTLFSLRFLNLSHNSLEQIKPSTFGTLPTVLELDLSHNQLQDVSRGALAKLASCSRLDVSHNGLQRIFQIPISLGELDFSYNNLSEIVANTWPSMNALLRLNLSHNQLGDKLDSESFKSLLSVLKLDLSSNTITKPPWEALSAFSSLQYLILRDNELTTLNKAAFGRLPVVFQLDMTNNNISSVSQRAFDGLLQLLDLSLSNNSLAHVPNEAFKGLVSLRKLDLSHNRLEKIDNKTNGLLDDCLSLEKVDLSHNQFSFLTPKTFPSDPYIPYKLLDIDLSHNLMPVVTADILRGTKHTERLNLAYNNINDIRRDVLGNLTSLKHLDLSGNQLNEFTLQTAEEVFKMPSTLETLNLSNSQLGVLPVNGILRSKKLKVLDISRNKLGVFHHRLVKELSNGMTVLFEDNPLECSCLARPLLHHINRLSSSAVRADAVAALVCRRPETLDNVKLSEVDEDRLVCNERMNLDQKQDMLGATEFDFTSEPDLKFRTVQFTKNAIHLQWFVLSTKDVADFQVFIRDQNSLIYQQDVSYALRSLRVPIEQNSTLKQSILEKKKLELCVLAKTSDDFPRSWFASQCKEVPTDYDRWRAYLKSEKSSALLLIGDSILITMCLFLTACFRICDS